MLGYLLNFRLYLLKSLLYLRGGWRREWKNERSRILKEQTKEKRKFSAVNIGAK